MFPRPPLGDEQRVVIDRVADLARTRFAGRAAGYDAESAFPYENYRDLHEAGLSHHPLVQRTLAEMGTAVRTAGLLLHEAARVRAAGDREATMLVVNQAKSYCADVGLMVTERAVRLAGGRGILKELPLERWHRDALAGPVMPPANDRCLETVGKLLCGLRAATLEFQ